jgi:uroporphyrin-III C-methyltransferase / precorrin-2 dehydrogenase / sirohydrochlorin ferrochelatase
MYHNRPTGLLPDGSLPYPAFLRLEDRHVIVVGGGPVAASKIPALLQAGAKVTVVAPRQLPVLDSLPVRRILRRFLASDLDGAWWVVAAATPAVNRLVRRAAERRHLFVNAVDDTSSGSAYLGAVLVRGDVMLALSTAGHAPALAATLRDALDALLPAEVAAWASLAKAERARWKTAGVPMAERRPRLLDALARLAAKGAP